MLKATGTMTGYFCPNVFIAFWVAHYAAEKLGCEVIPGGALNTEARILKMQELKATAMGATPTYVLGMADTARRKLGITALDRMAELCIRFDSKDIIEWSPKECECR